MVFGDGFNSDRVEKTLFKKVPEKGFKLFLFILTTYFGKVMLLNLMYLLFALPVVTAPAAGAAMSRVYMLLMRDGYTQLWADFVREFKSSFFKGLGLGAACGGAVALMVVAAVFYPQFFEAKAAQIICVGLACAIILLVSVLYSWAIPMIALYKLRLRDVFKNAAILLVACPKTSLCIAGIIIAFGLLAVGLFPQSVPFTVFILISLAQLGICVAVKEPFAKHLEPKKES